MRRRKPTAPATSPAATPTADPAGAAVADFSNRVLAILSRLTPPAAAPATAGAPPAAGAGGATAPPSMPFPELEPRATDYGQQLLQLRGLTGMDPILAATRGVLLDDELESLINGSDPVASQLADALRRKIADRVNAIHPVAVKT